MKSYEINYTTLVKPGRMLDRNGNQTTSASLFSFSLKINGVKALKAHIGDTVEASVTIDVDEEHRGKLADYVIFIKWNPLLNPWEDQWFFATQNKWMRWVNKNPRNLKPYATGEILRKAITLDIYDGIVDSAGRWLLYSGYRFDDGTLVYNATPLDFIVTE